MASVVESIDVNVPLSTAYNQWTQFEEFPRFMEGVKSVKQIDDTHLHWVAEVGGNEEEWDAAITEQRPDERVAWKSTSGAENAGVVTFHRLDDDTTRVTLQMDVERYVPGHGFIEEPKASREELVEYQRAMRAVIAEVTRLHKLGLSAEDAAKQADWGPYKEWFLAEQQGPIAVRKIYEEIEGKLK